MSYNRLTQLIALLICIGAFACGKPEAAKQITSGTPNGFTLPLISGPNVLSLTVNGAHCRSGSYPNKPCVSVQVCAPGTSNCQTINDILLDTGSYGLRVFKQAINPGIASGFTQILSGASPVAECVQYGDGSKDWGPIQTADVILGGEPAVTVPIQLIDSTFANSNAYCNGAETSPASAGFNGILGVGLFVQDCGLTCVRQTNNTLYFACNGSTCSGTAVPLANQVQNPVALLPRDNNGIIVQLPLVKLGGQNFANGYLVLGIGTESNNTPGDVVSYMADPNSGEFTTTINNKTYGSFLDSGSNGLFFVSGLPDCGSLNSAFTGWMCPTGTPTLTATNTSFSGSPASTILFQIGNMISLTASGNSVFIELGGQIGSNLFDWGLPFYLGRNIYVGFSGRTSSLGTGPYWAY